MTAPEPEAVSRRTVIGLAWATPVLALGVAAPAMAASPAQPVTISANTSDSTRFPISLTTTESLTAGTTFDVDIDGTANQWALNSSGTTPGTWVWSRLGSRGARFTSTATAPGTYEFVLGLAGIASYSGTILTVTTPEGQELTRVVL
ncbi:hypothetical protein C5E07_17970 [Pseudoclavibacter sp. RFBJ3]|uniref:hypothetical protein n=1 Tax=unclassified Pseudoclavibacter TaxID=2615177 RepID=UPI000CE8912C|nr:MULTISPECIES: hypothetical protein [unclassified Pseudoclavibacter]PPF87245.1 hypothetical protein C5C12_01030 [Pseudoclavibacter sp. RFBJ5]PPF89468.1 hypothetical protein C5E07_17970 [Pseudoclavibacter sp. RFBJ3]PPG00727.1 hypothetical protein C5C19_00770 [Pseudoclavibacter sp. RFBH5]PPG18836.1 hypothetical protein C5E13_17575 [Pseudoclavibacter sp. RFBI4]